MPEWMRRPAPVTFVVVAALVCAVYGGALDAPFIFDDTPSILENPSIRRVWPLLGSADAPGPLRPPRLGPTARRPVANLTLALDYQAAGRDPRRYRAINVALHVWAAVLLAAVVRRTLRLPYFGGAWNGVAAPLAAVVALVWALHPLVTEAVVYVTQRTELLMAACWLATLWAALRYWTAPAAGWSRAGWVGVAGVACAAGMASKEVMAGAPLVVLLCERTFLAPSVRAALRRSWPLYAALLVGWVVLFALNFWGARGVTADSRYAIPLHVWWWTQAKVLWLYLRLVVWPWPLSIYYAPRYLPTLASALPWLAASAALAVAIGLAVRRRPAVRFVVAAMALTLAPTIVAPVVKMMAAERRLYLPLAGVVVLGVVGAWRLLARWPAGALRTGATLAAGLLVVEGALSVRRLAAYDSAVGIWRDALRTQPDAVLAHYNLGVALLEARRPTEAMAAFEETLRREPDHTKARDNLGLALSQLGRPAEALALFEQALARDPGDAAARNNLAAALVRQGRAAEAIPHLDRALAGDPAAATASIHVTYAKALLELGRPADALAHLTRAVAADPDDADAQYSLGATLLAVGRPGDALAPLEAAVRLVPGDAEAHNNLANALLRSGRVDAAAAAYRQALALRPDYAEAHNNLGGALLHAGQVDAAIEHLQRALALKPGHANARYNLAGALLAAGRTRDAVAQYREAVRLAPDDARGRFELARALAQDAQPAEALATAGDGVALARAQGNAALVGEIDAWVVAQRGQATD